MAKLVYKNIFDAITNDQNEAVDLQFRADMMIAMRQLFEDRGWNPTQIGKKLGIEQPRVSELLNGKMSISSDKLIGYLAKVGFRIHPVYNPATPRKAASIKCDIEECATVA